MPQAAAPLLALVGPTASGKTGLAFALATRQPIEVISLDSAQVYRGMDIGTAKPDIEQQRQLPHHLIDICDPAEAYTAARFARDAQACVEDIRARGKLPVIVGGTLLYLRAFSQGLSDLPKADAALREQITAQAERRGWSDMHAELAGLDPDTAARLNPNDGHRILRALEICRLSGTTVTALQASRRPAYAGRMRTVLVAAPSRERLWERIEQRFERMMTDGFLDEVRCLHARPDLHVGLPAIRAVGYRQLWQHLEGDISLDEAVSRGIIATRQFAKRQGTWLRSQAADLALDPSDSAAVDALEQALIEP